MKSKLNTTFINGQMYSTPFVGVKIGDNIVEVNLTKLDYSETTAMENRYGLAQTPVGRTVGQIIPEVSMEIYKDSVQAIQRASIASGDSDGSLSSLAPLEIIVSFFNADYSKFTTDIIHNFQFPSNMVSLASGAMEITVALSGIASHISWGV